MKPVRNISDELDGVPAYYLVSEDGYDPPGIGTPDSDGFRAHLTEEETAILFLAGWTVDFVQRNGSKRLIAPATWERK